MKPAAFVIDAFGGVRATARALGISPSSVSLWKTRSKGKVPAQRWQRILAVAKEQHLRIGVEHLLYGETAKASRKK